MTARTKLILLGLGAAYCLYYFGTSGPGHWHFIDNVDLVIHEAGHVVFMFFGDLVTALGGSLLQLLVPVAFFAYFQRSGQKFSAAAVLLWLAVNLMNVGVYAADALRMRLELLGGENVTHDWNYILLELGLVRHAEGIGEAIGFLGLVAVAAALYHGWLTYSSAGRDSADRGTHGA